MDGKKNIYETSQAIGLTALRALLYEVSVTPKPGLVDRTNSGAHSDMDFFMFLDSGCAIFPYLARCAQTGMECSGYPVAEVFEQLQEIGLQAEREMLNATGGINTHRGAIFSLGVLCAAVGSCEAADQDYTEEDVFGAAARLGKCAQAKIRQHAAVPYHRFGLLGARGEAAQGFPHVRNIALPTYRTFRKKGMSANEAGARVLLLLIADVDDTNVAMRKGLTAARGTKVLAHKLLEGRSRSLSEIEALDRTFIQNNISPGGCADLLAAAFFLDFWAGYRKNKDVQAPR